MRKLLIYLDQSYISSMTKQLAGLTRPEHSALGQAMGELLDRLRLLVDEDRVLCPYSVVHDQELGLDDRLKGSAQSLLRELSDSVSFRTYRTIEYDQTVRALRRYLALPAEPEDGRWEHALYRNPHLRIKRPRVYVTISTPPEFQEDDRRRKAVIQSFREAQVMKDSAGLPATFRECRQHQVLGVAKIVYVDGFRDYLARMVGALGASCTAPAVSQMSDSELLEYLNTVLPPPGFRLAAEYAALTGRSDPFPGERYWRFFESRDFDAIPYYDIFCSLEAGFLFYKPQRKPKASDPYDMAALASVLPYVDIVTTDSAMKDMLLQLKLHEKYRVEVYSARRKEVEALSQRLARLARHRH